MKKNYACSFWGLCIIFYLTSCGSGKKCPDEFYLNEGVCIKLWFKYKTSKQPVPTELVGYTSFYENETDKEYPFYLSKYDNSLRIPLNVSTSVTRITLKGINGNTSLVISDYNPRIEFYDDDCGFQIKIDKPNIQYTNLDYQLKSFEEDKFILNIDVFI